MAAAEAADTDEAAEKGVGREDNRALLLVDDVEGEEKEDEDDEEDDAEDDAAEEATGRETDVETGGSLEGPVGDDAVEDKDNQVEDGGKAVE